MRDKVLAYALAISVSVHLIVLGVVGRTCAARPIEVEELKLVRVNLVSLPDEAVSAEVARSTNPSLVEREHAPVPPPEKIPTAPLPRIQRVKQRVQAPAQKLPGNPGGPLDIGSASARGEDLGAGGRTPMGWVPGAPEGTGVGSGAGPGIGKPEPVPGAVEGLGREAAPPPSGVDVKVCAESFMLPGSYCGRTAIKSFRPGMQPSSTCTLCKPKHVSVYADRSTPELVSGRRSPKYPESARARGIEGSVTVEYTINVEGGVVGAKVVSSSGNSELDRAAIETVGSRKYKPAVQAGIPRNYRKRETFRFSLN